MASALAALCVYRRAGSPPLSPPPAAPLSTGAPEARAVAAPVDSTPVVVGTLAPVALLAHRYDYELAVFHSKAPSPAALARARTSLGEAGYRVLADTPATLEEGRTAVLKQARATDHVALSEGVARFVGDETLDEARAVLRKAARVTTIAFRGPGASALPDYHVALQVLRDLEQAAPGSLWDTATHQAFTREAWAVRLVGWENGVPLAHRHVAIEGESQGAGTRLVTHGSSKLALPDFAVANVAKVDEQLMRTVLAVLLQTALEQPVLPAPGSARLRVDELRHPRAHAAYAANRPPGRTSADVLLAEAARQPHDPEGRLFELTFPGRASDVHQRQAALISELLGSRDDVYIIDRDAPGYLEAVAKARTDALALKPRVLAGLGRLETLQLKLPFEGPDGTHNLWIDVQKWEGTRVEGVLVNEPAGVPNLHRGSHVVVQESAIVDYSFVGEDGVEQGDLTHAFAKPAGSH
jgi:uncharacterized protein YegJ (DUF2314 family)